MRHHRTTFDHHGFTVGFSLDWSHLFFAGLALLFLALTLVVGIAVGVGVWCD
jgi:hypothetical protein